MKYKSVLLFDLSRKETLMNGDLSPLIKWLTVFNPYPADHEYCCFYPVLLVDQITDIGKERCV